MLLLRTLIIQHTMKLFIIKHPIIKVSREYDSYVCGKRCTRRYQQQYRVIKWS